MLTNPGCRTCCVSSDNLWVKGCISVRMRVHVCVLKFRDRGSHTGSDAWGWGAHLRRSKSLPRGVSVWSRHLCQLVVSVLCWTEGNSGLVCLAPEFRHLGLSSRSSMNQLCDLGVEPVQAWYVWRAHSNFEWAYTSLIAGISLNLHYLWEEVRVGKSIPIYQMRMKTKAASRSLSTLVAQQESYSSSVWLYSHFALLTVPWWTRAFGKTGILC